MVKPHAPTVSFRSSFPVIPAKAGGESGNDRLLIYLARAMKEKVVPSAWLEREGRRLDCGPCLSGVMEAKVLLERLPVPRAGLCRLTRGHEGGVYNGPQFVRNYVSDSDHGIPFLTGSTMLHADFAHADLLKKSDATSPRLAHLRIEEGTTLVSCSGTIGRMSCARPEMTGMWSSQDILKIVSDPALVRPGYLYAFLTAMSLAVRSLMMPSGCSVRTKPSPGTCSPASRPSMDGGNSRPARSDHPSPISTNPPSQASCCRNPMPRE